MSNLPILFYLICVLIVGLAPLSRRDRSADEYFFGGRTAGSVAFGSSLVLTNILRYQIILLPLAALGWFWVAVAGSVLVVALSYMSQRNGATEGNPGEVYGNGVPGVLVNGIVLLSYMTVQIAALLAISNLILKDILNLDYSASALIIVVFAGIYAIVGGFTAVAHTQTFQLFVMLGGIVALAIMNAIPPPDSLLPAFASSDELTTWGAFLGLPVVSLWVWHYDRLTLVQSRAPRNPFAMKSGLLLAGGAAIILALLVMLFPSASGSTEGGVAHEVLLLTCFAALMASFAASFAGAAELASNEFFRRAKPSASEQEQVLVGRLVTAAIAGLTIIMLPMVQAHSAGLLQIFLIVQVSLFPPITALFAAKSFFKTLPQAGILPSLIIGESLGILRLVLSFVNTEQISGTWVASWFISMDHFMFAFCLFGFSLLVLYGVGAVLGFRLRAADRLT